MSGNLQARTPFHGQADLIPLQQTPRAGLPANSWFSLCAPLWTEYRGTKSTLSLFVQTYTMNTFVLKVKSERVVVVWDFFEKDKIFSCSGSQGLLLL